MFKPNRGRHAVTDGLREMKKATQRPKEKGRQIQRNETEADRHRQIVGRRQTDTDRLWDGGRQTQTDCGTEADRHRETEIEVDRNRD